MDDVGAPDIYFFTVKPLAEKLNVELKAFAEAQGW